MKTIHIAGSGAPAGVGMARCLKDYYDLQGHDSSPWATLMMECKDEVEGMNLWHTDMVIPVPDPLVLKYAESDICFLPSKEQILICQDKLQTAELLGDLAPKIYWGRDIQGAGGKGAEMISEYLPGNNYSVEFVYNNGTELAHFQKRRVSYSLKERTVGLDNRGSSMVSVCTNCLAATMRARQALQCLPGELHGFYGVDLKENQDGELKVTEINAGRLLTASYHYYYITGYNLPLIGVRSFFGEEMPELPEYPEGQMLLRQIDQQPKLIEATHSLL